MRAGAGEAAEEPGHETTPALALDGFIGSLEQLLLLARARRIDLERIPVGALVDQLVEALQQAGQTPLGQQADWVVMAAWLLQLRAQLLLPADSAVHQEALADAEALQERLRALQAAQALAGWLEVRPQLGQDVFARGCPEIVGTLLEPAHQLDVVEFLWASLALFEEAPDLAIEEDRPARVVLHDVITARARILQLLAGEAEGALLACFLPEPPDTPETDRQRALRRRSAWASTLVAGLELAREGGLVLLQEESLGDIRVTATQAASG
ncbi:MAG: segregation/condensation protein A [Rhodospirillales bacterium]|nr:segregation/condensation protein A [Rhodospirillales bacterium]